MQDLSLLLVPLSVDMPAGDNLEFDPDFGALERAAQGKGEQQFGATIVAAEEPDWKDVEAQALALLDRSRDLRVLALLAVARLQLYGLPGFAGVIACGRAVLETMWPAVHPQLDAEDDNDPTLRANALLRLGDPARVLRVLRDLPLATSPRAGRVSWREIGIASGVLETPEGREKPSESLLRGAFQDTDPSRLTELTRSVIEASANLAAIGTIFDTQAGFGTGPDLADLIKLLREIQRHVERYTPAATAPAADAEQQNATVPVAVMTAATGTVEDAGGSPATLRPITRRADAMLLLDLVRAYYERYEPSSPLPLLLERAQRLADKNFVDILRDIAPDGLGQAQTIMGERNE